MDPKLKTLMTVMELESYTEAATVLHLTQPAVSQHIKRLESIYQCKLVFFEGRVLHFTKSAYLLYDFAKIQNAYQEVLFQKLEGVENPVSIGMTLSIADYYFPTSLRSYLIEECVNFKIKVANTDTLLEDLKSGVIDCALVEGMFDQDIFTSHIFTEARFMPVVARNHPLAGQSVSLEKLLLYPVIVREPGSGTRSIFENWLTAHNHRLTSFQSVQEIGSFQTIKTFLKQSHAVSFMYTKVAHEEIENKALTYLDLEDFELKRPLHFVYLKHHLKQKEIEAIYHLTQK